MASDRCGVGDHARGGASAVLRLRPCGPRNQDAAGRSPSPSTSRWLANDGPLRARPPRAPRSSRRTRWSFGGYERRRGRDEPHLGERPHGSARRRPQPRRLTAARGAICTATAIGWRCSRSPSLLMTTTYDLVRARLGRGLDFGKWAGGGRHRDRGRLGLGPVPIRPGRGSAGR